MSYTDLQKRLIQKTALLSIAVSGFLITIKLFAWFLTRSIAMQAALLDSVQDFVVSIMNLFAIRHAIVPADNEHRFGHGKAESLSSLLQAALIAATALYLIWEACERFFHPIPVDHSMIGIGVMLLSSAVTLLLVRLQGRTIKATGSLAIAGDALHYRTDLIVNGGVIISLIVSGMDSLRFIDPLIGLAIAGYILHAAYELGSDAVHVLMDHELPTDIQEQIIAAIQSETTILGYHDLKSRTSGATVFIQMHLELDGTKALNQTSIVVQSVENKIKAILPAAEVIIAHAPKKLINLKDRPIS